MKPFLPLLLLSLLVSCGGDTQVAPDNYLTMPVLNESLSLGRSFLLSNQKRAGNFEYEYDFVTKTYADDDNQVRQAGALWGVSLIHREHPADMTEKALLRGFDFFFQNSIETEDGRKFIVYPGEEKGRTGTMALFVLSLIEFLAVEEIPVREHFETELEKYIAGLKSLRRTDGRFSSSYNLETGERFGSPSPYFDGESLLALVKAAKEQGYDENIADLLASAEVMYQANVVDALLEDPDSDTTKGFYQWGSMAFHELFTSGWEGTQHYARRTIDLAYWMIDVHQTLKRTRNTSYAYEGIIPAWDLARRIDDDASAQKFASVIHQGLSKLTSWQIGSSIQNDYLSSQEIDDSKALGGIMNKKDEPFLRIDVTQHQMHAVILARRLFLR